MTSMNFPLFTSLSQFSWCNTTLFFLRAIHVIYCLLADVSFYGPFRDFSISGGLVPVQPTYVTCVASYMYILVGHVIIYFCNPNLVRILHVVFFVPFYTDKPSAPRGLKANDVTASSAVLTWLPPESDGGAPITNYVVEKSTSFSARWVRASKAAVTSLRLELDDLVENTSYEFRVSAENDAGVGPSCQPVGPIVAKEPKGKASHFLFLYTIS